MTPSWLGDLRRLSPLFFSSLTSVSHPPVDFVLIFQDSYSLQDHLCLSYTSIYKVSCKVVEYSNTSQNPAPCNICSFGLMIQKIFEGI